jgi:hypothetical protein
LFCLFVVCFVVFVCASWNTSWLQFCIYSRILISYLKPWTTAFFVIYLITLEVFPTAIRASMLGLCSTGARIGSMSSSYIGKLVRQYTGSFILRTFGTVFVLFVCCLFCCFCLCELEHILIAILYLFPNPDIIS